jgi:membrane protein implicated in regulation of membrane protease activity
MLITAIFLTVGAMRPDRDPQLIYMIYDMGFMCFEGTMGIFAIGTVVWMTAILIDKNKVFPKWFGYLNICNMITEFVISPAWILKQGALSWNGSIAFWIDTIVFAIYTVAFIVLLRKLIQREDFGDGVLAG